MNVIFDLLTSPLGLNINPLLEWVIMLIVGEIAYRYAYDKVGDLDVGIPIFNFILHWVIRFIIYAMLWALCRGVTDAYNFIRSLFKSIFH